MQNILQEKIGVQCSHEYQIYFQKKDSNTKAHLILHGSVVNLSHVATNASELWRMKIQMHMQMHHTNRSDFLDYTTSYKKILVYNAAVMINTKFTFVKKVNIYIAIVNLEQNTMESFSCKSCVGLSDKKRSRRQSSVSKTK